MEKITLPREANLPPPRSASPSWWTSTHASRWERVRDALRRDWEQTKSDFAATNGGDLQQGLADTVRQAVGDAPIPALSEATRHDQPKEVAKRVEDELKARGKARERADEAKVDIAVDAVRAQAEIGEEQRESRERIIKAQAKLADIVADARQEVVDSAEKAERKSLKQREKIAEVRADEAEKIAHIQRKMGDEIARAPVWERIEPAVRFGYGARWHYADVPAWSPDIELRLRQDWSQLTAGSPWDEVMPHVRHGWDSASLDMIAHR